MKRRIISLLLAILLLCSLPLLSFRAAAEVISGSSGNISWTLDKSSGALTISGTGDLEDYWVKNNCGFQNLIKSVTIGQGITGIGRDSFAECNYLESVSIPDTVAWIGIEAFIECYSLHSIELPEGLTRIEGAAFAFSGLSSIVLPETLTFIGANAFADTCLSTVDLPASVTEIESGAFSESLCTSICIPEGITEISSFLFSYCWQLSSVELPESITAIGDYAFYHTAIESLQIPESVTTIGENAFQECHRLRSITLPSGLTDLGIYAFASCDGLLSVDIPDGLSAINNGSFYGCDSLRFVVVPASVTEIGEKALGYSHNDYNGEAQLTDGFTIYGCSGSAAESYASENGIRFVPLSGASCAEGHRYDVWFKAKAPSCTEEGISLRVCKNCGAVETRVSEALGHSYLEEIVPPSCNARGRTIHTCFRCGDSYEDSYTPPLGHSWDNGRILLNATFSSEGTLQYTCTRCGEKRWETIPKLTGRQFDDVQDPNAPYYSAVYWAVSHKPYQVTAGIDATHFGPNQTVTRAQAMTFFWAAQDRPKYKKANTQFVDVKKTDWFYKSVMWAVENGVTAGTDATHFSPNKTCNRGEILAFLYAALKKPKVSISNPYKDVKNQWYKKAALWAYANGIEKGESGKFNAATPCTRATVVTYLYRFKTGYGLAE